MLKYIFSILIAIPLCLNAQDTIPDSSRRLVSGFGFGFDLANVAVNITDGSRSIFAASFELKLKRRTYGEFVFGTQNQNFEKKLYDYSSNGWFGKIGYRYDFLNKENPSEKGLAFVGFRYAMSTFNFQVENLSFINTYWGNYSTQIDKENFTCYWLEFGGGIQEALIGNFYLGWSAYGRLMMYAPEFEYFDPKNIPGYGKGNSKFNVGFEYHVFYKFPLE